MSRTFFSITTVLLPPISAPVAQQIGDDGAIALGDKNLIGPRAWRTAAILATRRRIPKHSVRATTTPQLAAAHARLVQAAVSAFAVPLSHLPPQRHFSEAFRYFGACATAPCPRHVRFSSTPMAGRRARKPSARDRAAPAPRSSCRPRSTGAFPRRAR